MNELEFIGYLKRNIKRGRDVIYGIGDDAAVIKYTREKYLLFASDMLIQGVHFSKDADPKDIGRKAVSVNISDIAAMGGIPKYVLMSVGVPKAGRSKILKSILNGAKAVCKKYDITIVGGDTNEGRNLVIDTAIIGEVEKKSLTLRSGAKIGDLIFVTGTLGEGRLRHLKFTPRIRQARTLTRLFKINSMIDISDGLFLDLYRLATASNVGALIYKSLIPLSERSTNFKEALEYGEDFELLFTLSVNEARKLMRYVGRYEYPDVTLIGKVVSKRRGLNFVGDEGRIHRIKPRGYVHLK